MLSEIKGPETPLKDFVATFLSTHFGAKTGLPASSNLNVRCCALAVTFSPVFRIKCKKKKSKLY